MVRWRTIAVALLGVGSVTSNALAETRWSVRAGDTIAALARRFEVKQADLRHWNALDDDRLQIGQELVIKSGPEAGSGGSTTDRSKVPRTVAAKGQGKAKPETPRPEAAARPSKTAVRPGADGPSYQIADGDTLSGIAQRFSVSIDQLLAWNPDLDPDRIRAGQSLSMGFDGRRVTHRVRAGDTLTAVARRYRVTLAKLQRWNPGLQPDRLRTGQALTVYTKVPTSRSRSVGTPSKGKLQFAARLRPHRGYRIRDNARAWGTEEVVWHMERAFDRVLEQFPGAPKVEVHDLSFKAGGPISHHRSHQSGRDVDIAYFHNACKGRTCRFDPVGGQQLDVARQWALLSYWLKRDQLEAVFMDYSLQAALYRHAKRKGASDADLKHWFQYPRGRSFPLGVIRHYPKHADHMHVRFACHKSDPECKTFRPLLMRARRASHAKR